VHCYPVQLSACVLYEDYCRVSVLFKGPHGELLHRALRLERGRGERSGPGFLPPQRLVSHRHQGPATYLMGLTQQTNWLLVHSLRGSWLQPPGYVHQMYHESWLPGALAVSRTGEARALSVSAQLATDRSQLRLLVVNAATRGLEASVSIAGWKLPGVALVTTLAAPTLDSANAPFSGRISPERAVVSWANSSSFPALSVTVLLLNATVAM
jgi:hypothetical protein